ncbi:HAMP domain-containing histidine kinase [Psychrobium sp. MM17-31]|uniref:sensor histidine kinase n=1 Tax=Psychrobium sp. MM17-31 TaxID=2917758 RepID=UPI001EF40465|nr:HAMP domain-containing sensor histidine kinase [Psychrobium sp. MM17-31]MCG7532406.1 HAMP domain-containing histidine kinase [Psychrobium sp. MM17-31]
MITLHANRSLESYLAIRFVLLTAVLLALCGVILYQLEMAPWNIAILLGLIGLFCAITLNKIYRRIIATYERSLLHIESMRVEDYNQYAKSDFKQGTAAELHQQLRALSEHLAEQKSRYDQHAFLVYQLIDQLNIPILVFNQKNKLSYANGAFSMLYAQPWQMFRNASPKLLNLSKRDNKWQLEKQSQQWQISQSEFIDDGQTHQLLVFTNIESVKRESQQTAWQQIIRVMSHEIRNSLTPVSSLAESLATRSSSERDQKALALIHERCHHLQDFVSRYSSLSQQFNLAPKQINTAQLKERLNGLFNEQQLDISLHCQWLWADQTFLEQVLINLIKNAVEAGANDIALAISQHGKQHEITVTDNGHGFANLDNLFVPLFTTKTQGQGIGLNFCRNIVEQHNGSIALENNKQGGVTVTIKLPSNIS